MRLHLLRQTIAVTVTVGFTGGTLVSAAEMETTTTETSPSTETRSTTIKHNGLGSSSTSQTDVTTRGVPTIRSRSTTVRDGYGNTRSTTTRADEY
jgi:hypothetical protein